MTASDHLRAARRWLTVDDPFLPESHRLHMVRYHMERAFTLMREMRP